MKIFVTGADGFIGSHLCEALAAAGHEVTAGILFANEPRSWLDVNDSRFRPYFIDVRQPGYNTLLREVDVCYHLAALGDVPPSRDLPHVYCETNIIGTLNMARQCAFEDTRFILMSTSEVYGGADGIITEETPVHPRSIYAATKVSAEALVTACRHMYGLKATIVRGFNTYGPRQSRRGVIAELIAQHLDPAVKMVKLGNFDAARDFVYVEDMARALAMLVDHPDVEGPLNIATGLPHTVRDIAHAVRTLTESGKLHTEETSRRRENYEVDRLEGDASKFMELTGWQPEVDIDEGLRRTIDWWRGRMT